MATTSNQQNPIHIYTTPGLYNVTLTVGTEFGCSETVTKYRIYSGNSITHYRHHSKCISCLPGRKLLSSRELKQYRILPYFAGPGILQTDKYRCCKTRRLSYTEHREYFTVQLITTNSSGCTDTTNQLITINPLPTVVATPDTTICLGQSVQLNATGANTYLWLPPANNLSCTACPNPIASPTVTTTYLVRGTTALGCERVDSVRITVIQPSTVVAPPDDSLCLGQSLVLRATGTQVYSWTPAASLNNPNVARPHCPANNHYNVYRYRQRLPGLLYNNGYGIGQCVSAANSKCWSGYYYFCRYYRPPAKRTIFK